MLPESTTPGGDAPDDEDVLPEAKDAVEAEADETEEKSAEDEGAEPGDEAEEDGEPKKLSKTAKKNARIRAKIETLEEIARHESKRADEATAALKALSDDVGPQPKREDFVDDVEYGAALSAFEADKRIVARTKKTTETNATEARDAANASKHTLFRERALALVERYPDIEARVFNDANPVSPVMAEVIQDSERGPEVAYHLATHREEAQRIFRMPPLAAARELGRIEATLDAPKPRIQSNAPPPPQIVKGGKTLAAKDPDKMTTDEWLVWRNAQLDATNKRKRA